MTCLAAFTLVALAVHSAEPPRFERDVKPILVAKCVKCHGGETTKSGLDLRTASAIRQGGDTGPSVLSNDPSKSLLFEQITSGAMPPGKVAKLTPAETATIKAWIEAGAKADEPDIAGRDRTHQFVNRCEREMHVLIERAVHLRERLEYLVPRDELGVARRMVNLGRGHAVLLADCSRNSREPAHRPRSRPNVGKP